MSFQALKMWRKQITRRKVSIWKGYIIYNSNYVKFWKKKNHGDGKIQWLPGVAWMGGEVRCGWGRMSRQSTEDFLSNENSLYTITMGTCHYTFVQTGRHVPHQEWTIIQTMDLGWLWQSGKVGSPILTKVPLWWATLIMGEAVHMQGKGHKGNLCTFPLVFLWTWKKF